jgi:hypothetical protein
MRTSRYWGDNRYQRCILYPVNIFLIGTPPFLREDRLFNLLVFSLQGTLAYFNLIPKRTHAHPHYTLRFLLADTL